MEAQRRLPLLIAVLLLALPFGAARAAAPRPGEPAPPLVLRDFSGALHDLAGLRGQVVLVHYWASWCVPCREEMPRLDALAREHAGRLTVLAVSADDRHDRKAAQQVAAAFAFPAGLLAESPRNGFGPALGLPTTWVVDGEGRIAAVVRGGQGDAAAALAQALAPLGIVSP